MTPWPRPPKAYLEGIGKELVYDKTHRQGNIDGNGRMVHFQIEQGYKQTRVYRRGLPPPGSKNPVETECTLQRI
jgi:hypothetical protein